MAQAACPWAHTTANQPGLIGCNWAKGWVIENFIIHDAKWLASALGKGGNPYFLASHIGWERKNLTYYPETTGLHDCIGLNCRTHGPSAIYTIMKYAELEQKHLNSYGHEMVVSVACQRADVQIHETPGNHHCTLVA